MSIIEKNLMEQKGYSPYCGDPECKVMPRSKFDGEQFKCPSCGWRSYFKDEFIEKYKEKWGLT